MNNQFLTRIIALALSGLLVFPVLVLADPPPISSDVVVSADVATTTTTGTTSTSGGGGGGGYTSPTSITFSGRAYPLSKVIVLKDGQDVVETIAGGDAKFTVTLANLSAGTYTFSILSEDSQGRRSTLFTIPILITSGVSTTISGIFLSPTIEIDKQEVKKGETLTIFGQTTPNAEVTIEIHSDEPVYTVIPADSDGVYLNYFNTAPLAYGDHDTKSKALLTASNEVTSYSKILTFKVGDTTIYNEEGCPQKADLNDDCRVNLIDFSILAYWYKKPNPPQKDDLNSDGKVNIVDFSIMAYYWTG